MPQAVKDPPLPPGYKLIADEPTPQPAAPAPAPYQDSSASQVAAGQIGQIPGGIKDFAKSLSPVDMSQGYAQFQVPPAITGLLSMAGRGFQGPTVTPEMITHRGQQMPPADLSVLKSITQPISAVGQGVHALVDQSAPAPSGQEWQQATRGGTSALASLLGPEALAKGGDITSAIPKAATAAGIPQLLSEIAESPAFKYLGGAPVMRAIARRLYEPPAPSPMRAAPINAEFVNQEQPPIDVPSTPSGRTALPAGNPPAEAPTTPPQLGGSGGPQGAVTGPQMTKQLAPVAPGTQLFKGEEGGVGPQPHADVTAQTPMLVRAYKGDGSGYTPGQIRPETVIEMKGRLTNFGRGTTKQPAYDAQPYVPPKPPKAPKAPPKTTK